MAVVILGVALQGLVVFPEVAFPDRVDFQTLEVAILKQLSLCSSIENPRHHEVKIFIQTRLSFRVHFLDPVLHSPILLVWDPVPCLRL